AEAAEDPRGMWEAMVRQLAATQQASAGLHCGFLSGLQKHDAKLADVLLDEALEHEALAEWFPYLQACTEIDARGVVRLRKALDLGKAAITSYDSLAYGRASDRIPGPEFRDL